MGLIMSAKSQNGRDRGLKNIALIVAAGSGSRSKQKTPKQYSKVRGKAMIAHSALSFAQHSEIDALYIVIGEGQEELAKTALSDINISGFIIGGNTRQESVRNGLDYLSDMPINKIFIHDAARPFLPHKVIDDLLIALDRHDGAIPTLPIADSIAYVNDGTLAASANRDAMARVQTPQAFNFQHIYAAHKNIKGNDYSDDAQIMHAAGHNIAIVNGDASLHKYTFAEDFMTEAPKFRIGSGYDVHRFGAGYDLWLGGIKIDHNMGLVGHSDADIVLHALTDALLGALAMGDIGDHFPPSDPQWKGASSDIFMKYACKLAHDKGYVISNADITIICEAPKIGPHRENIRDNIAKILEIPVNQISLKATTTEKLGFTGRGEGMAVQAQILIEKST